MGDRIKEAITEWFGPRCDEVEPGCPACDAWAEFDQLAEARNSALEEAAIKGPIPCYETRHVTLGDKVKDAIRALKEPTND